MKRQLSDEEKGLSGGSKKLTKKLRCPGCSSLHNPGKDITNHVRDCEDAIPRLAGNVLPIAAVQTGKKSPPSQGSTGGKPSTPRASHLTTGGPPGSHSKQPSVDTTHEPDELDEDESEEAEVETLEEALLRERSSAEQRLRRIRGNPISDFYCPVPKFAGLGSQATEPNSYPRSKGSMLNKHYNVEVKIDQEGVAANGGTFLSYLNQVKVPSKEGEWKKPKGAGAYDANLAYFLEASRKVVALVNDAKHVFCLHDYPCVIITLPAGIPGSSKIEESLAAILNAYMDWYAARAGIEMPCVQRASFDFASPTTAGLALKSIRLSLGLSPLAYQKAAAEAIKAFLGHVNALVELIDEPMGETIFCQNPYLDLVRKKKEAKQKKDAEQKKPQKKKKKDDEDEDDDDNGPYGSEFTQDSTLRDYMCNKLTTKNLFNELWRMFDARAELTKLAICGLHNEVNAVHLALQGIILSNRWKVSKSVSTQKLPVRCRYTYRPLREQKAPCAVAPDESKFKAITGSLQLLALQQDSDSTLVASGSSGGNEGDDEPVAETIDERWSHTLLAIRLLFWKSMQRHQKPQKDTRKDKMPILVYGSDSEEEDDDEDGLYHIKCIAQNGMHAIRIAMEFLLHGGVRAAGKPPESLGIVGMYYETPTLLGIVKKSAQAINKSIDPKTTASYDGRGKTKHPDVLIGDRNHCQTGDPAQAVKGGMIHQLKWADSDVIVDITSSTTLTVKELVTMHRQRIKKNPQTCLILVSSGLKNEQLTADMNPYGTVRFLVSVKQKERLLKLLEERKWSEGTRFAEVQHEESALSDLPHSVRRYFKSIGAVMGAKDFWPDPATKD